MHSLLRVWCALTLYSRKMNSNAQPSPLKITKSQDVVLPMVAAASTAETKTAIDVSTITTEDLKRWVETVVQLKDLISSPPLVSELTQILTANHEAMSVITTLIRPLGFVPAEEHVEARLPPLLEAFKTLNEEDQLDSFLKDPSFLEAQQSVQQTPNDSGALTALQQFTSKVAEMYDSAIQKRLQKHVANDNEI